MRRIRVIPMLLIHKGGLYKSTRFKNYKYVGDPINAVKIFNEKEVDEIVVLDIDATAETRTPDIRTISKIAGEAFMPMTYGGGISTIEEIQRILYEGVEKVVINSGAVSNPGLIAQAAKLFGSSSVVVSIDYKSDWLGRKRVFTLNGSKNIGQDPLKMAISMEELGAGEILLNCIDKDGTYSGYDVEYIREISHRLTVPVVVCGGASSIEDFRIAVQAGASAVAAGSMFVFQRPHNAVLISYPSQEQLSKELYLSSNHKHEKTL